MGTWKPKKVYINSMRTIERLVPEVTMGGARENWAEIDGKNISQSEQGLLIRGTYYDVSAGEFVFSGRAMERGRVIEVIDALKRSVSRR